MKMIYNITTIYISNIPTIIHLQNKNTKMLPNVLWFSQYSVSGLFNVNILSLLIFRVMTLI